MDTIESQIEDINNQINQLTFKKLELEMQLDNSKHLKELKLLQDDLTNITCCDETFFSNKAYNRHISSQKHKVYKNEPKFRCGLCNIYIFDGVWSLAELQKDPIKMLNSNYRKHIDNDCERVCPKCGYDYAGSRYKKQNHKCKGTNNVKVVRQYNKQVKTNNCDVEKYKEQQEYQSNYTVKKTEEKENVIRKLDSKTITKKYNGKEYTINTRTNKVILGCKIVGQWNAINETITFNEKSLEVNKEVVITNESSDDIPDFTSESETSSSEIETETWKYNGHRYEVDNRNNVYDESHEKIGKKYGEKIKII